MNRQEKSFFLKQLVTLFDLEEMFEQVRIEKVDAAMVPIENSLAGRVADTQRLIPNSKLKITQEFF